MKELKSGERIKIEDENLQELLKGYNAKKNAIKFMVADLSESALNIGQNIMAILEINKPEIKGYNYSYNHETNEITILYKK